MDRQGIIETLKREAPPFCEKADVVAAYLFGSWAREESNPKSDVDIGVFLRAQRLETSRWPPPDVTLEDALASRTALPVEVHVLNAAPLSVTGRVLEEGILIYSGDEVARVRIEVSIRGQYHDFKPRLARLHRLRLKAFAEKGLQ